MIPVVSASLLWQTFQKKLASSPASKEALVDLWKTYTQSLENLGERRHLLHADYVLQQIDYPSRSPVSTGLFILYQQVFQLPSIKPEPFYTAMTILEQKCSLLPKSSAIEQIEQLLSELLPPEDLFSFFSEEDANRRLQSYLSNCERITSSLAKEETLSASLSIPLKIIRDLYKDFLGKWGKSNLQKRQKLLEGRVKLNGLGIGFFSLSAATFQKLFEQNFHERDAIPIQCKNVLRPEIEYAVYALYQLLDSNGVGPINLIRFYSRKGISIHGVDIQAKGIYLRNLLEVQKFLIDLERGIGAEKAQQLFAALVEDSPSKLNSFEKILTSFGSRVEMVKKCLSKILIDEGFASFSDEEKYDRLLEWTDFWDPQDFSIHFLIHLLTSPSTYSTDDFVVTWDPNRPREKSLKVISINNSSAFAESNETAYSPLYRLPPMKKKIDSTILNKLKNYTPEQLLLDWLIALEIHNQSYERWKNPRNMQKKETQDDGEPSFGMPSFLSNGLVFRLYRQLQQLVNSFAATFPTPEELLATIKPELHFSYQKAQKNESKNYNDTFSEISLIDSPFIAKASNPKQTILRSAQEFIESIAMQQLSIESRANFIDKVLEFFPSLSFLPSLYEEDFNERKKIFFLALNQKKYKLVTYLLEKERYKQLQEGKSTNSLINQIYSIYKISPWLFAVKNLDLTMCKILLSYHVNTQAVDLANRGALVLCILELTESEEICQKVHEIANFLIDEADVLVNACSGHRFFTPLHYLVQSKALKSFNTIAKELLSCLIKKGACPDLINIDGKTPLDLALEEGNLPLVQEMIDLGAGRILQVERAIEFFSQRSDQGATYLRLQETSPLLRWHLALEELRASEKDTSRCRLKSELLGDIGLGDEEKSQLFDTSQNIKKQNIFGKHSVAKLVLKNGESLFFKQYPEMPGLQFAVESLFGLLTGNGVSNSELAKISFEGGLSYPVMVSQGISGENLHDVIRDPHKMGILQELDPVAFSELFLTSLMVNFEDAKPDNFIVSRLPNGQYQLVSIDNDHAFVSPLTRTFYRTTQLQMKCIIYCFDMMNEPLHPLTRKRFLSIPTEQLLTIWLRRVELKNAQYEALFSEHEREILAAKHNVLLFAHLDSNAIEELYEKFERLQNTLKELPELTLIEILRIIFPQLGIRYQEALNKYPAPLERFSSLTNASYSSTMNYYLQTLVAPSALLTSMNIISYNPSIRNTCKPMVDQVSSIGKQRISAKMQLQNIQQELYEGIFKQYSRLQNLYREQVLSGTANGLSPFDFLLIKKNEVQQQVFEAICVGTYQALSFHGCSLLNAYSWRKIVQSSPELFSLELNDCSSINTDFFSSLQTATLLNRLILKKLKEITHIELPHPHLERLHIEDCPKLQTLHLSPNVKQLSLISCSNLESVKSKQYVQSLIYAPYLSTTSNHLILQSLFVRHCPKLRPWKKLFENWLKNSPESIIQLSKIPLNPKVDSLDLLRSVMICPKKQEMMSALAMFEAKKNNNLSIGWAKAFSRYLKSQANIKVLDLSDYSEGKFEDLKNLLHISRHIEGLILSDWKNLSQKELKKFLRQCTFLQYLELQNCCVLDSTFDRLELRYLKHLNLSGCDNITDKLLVCLSYYCKGIISLKLDYCIQLTDEAVNYISLHYPLIERLSLNGSVQLTDKSLHFLGERCCNLKTLQLQGCDQITTEGVTKLLDHSTSLQRLKVENCKNISDDYRKKMVSKLYARADRDREQDD